MAILVRSSVIKEALEWVKTPFHSNQSVKGVGCDCVGFFLGISKNIGFLEPSYCPPNHGRFARGSELISFLDSMLEPQELFRHKPGDIIATKQMEIVSHLVIMIDDCTVANCSHRLGVTLAPLARFSLFKSYRFPGIIDG